MGMTIPTFQGCKLKWVNLLQSLWPITEAEPLRSVSSPYPLKHPILWASFPLFSLFLPHLRMALLLLIEIFLAPWSLGLERREDSSLCMAGETRTTEGKMGIGAPSWLKKLTLTQRRETRSEKWSGTQARGCLRTQDQVHSENQSTITTFILTVEQSDWTLRKAKEHTRSPVSSRVAEKWWWVPNRIIWAELSIPF